MLELRTPTPSPCFLSFPKLSPLLSFAILLLHLTNGVLTVSAEMPITSSGLNTHISSPVSVGGKTQYDITGGTRAGANLFHSFGNFDVPHNTIANFHNESMYPTENILGRVTGNSVSDIFGTIKTTEFGLANLFLMNPAGFLFGPNASLHIGGTVAFTSAEYLRLSNETQTGYFYADPTRSSLLTPWPVAAFGFLGSSPGAITVQGSQLKVTEGTSLSLVGGNIIIESASTNKAVRSAQLSVPNGNIHLATAASPGELPADINVFSLGEPLTNIDGHSLAAFGAITLTPNSTINVSGANTVSIRGGHFVLSLNDATLSTTESTRASNSIWLAQDSAVISSNSGPTPGANIHIGTETLLMNGAEITSRTSDAGPAGSVGIIAHDSILLANNSTISAFTYSSDRRGAGGDIFLQAPFLDLLPGSQLSSQSLGSGRAGNISVHANMLNLSGEAGQSTDELNGAVITTTTSGSGAGGNISILGLAGLGSRALHVTLSHSSSLRSETLGGTGHAGNITVETARLSLTDDAKITTTSRENSLANAGSIALNTAESILIAKSFVTSDVREGSGGIGGQITITTPQLTVNGGLISTSTSSIRNAGTITVNATTVTLTDGGRLASSSSLETPLPPPTGSAGTVVLQGLKSFGTHAESIVITGQNSSGLSSGIVTDTQGIGPGGNITLIANHVQLDHGAKISANSSGVADAGNINITATNGFSMTKNSSITTLVPQNITGGSAGGGNIKVTTSPSSTVLLQNSTINASVGDGRGGGGNISIDPQLVILQGSKILARADEGRGGKITIVAGLVLPDANSTINADSGSGVNGTVTIQSPTSNLSGTVGQLVSKTSPLQTLLHSRCAALVGGHESTFVFAGRGTLPPEPDGWLLSQHPLMISEADGSLSTDTSLRAGNNTRTGEPSFLPLRHIGPQEFLPQIFTTNHSAGCMS